MNYQKNSKYGESTENITPEDIYLDRRQFLKNSADLGTAAVLGGFVGNTHFTQSLVGKPVTEEKLALSHNNFYEFSLEKSEVQKKVENWKLDPASWKIEVEGLVEKKGKFSIEELIRFAGNQQEERIYRFRCVEAWSMVLPWGGVELGKLISSLKPQPSAKYIVFQSFKDPKIGPNIEKLSYPWPYQEGLTLEEAKNPLTLLATGLYGKPLPKQSGAPIRLVVPWKYGFKSIKSITKISFTSEKPKTLWNELAPKEYGFYANVNPNVDHPRWSQSRETVIDGRFIPTRQKTILFNGYENEVKDLYKGLDLATNF